MRLVIVCLVAFTLSDRVQAAEDDASYIAAHHVWCERIDAAISRAADAPRQSEAAQKADDEYAAVGEEARADLLGRMRALIGPFAPAGLTITEVAVSPITIVSQDYADNYVDGLLFRVEPYGARILVSDHALLWNWLKGDTPCGIPHGDGDIAMAMLEPEFYQEALTDFPQFYTLADIPVAKPETAKTVFAMVAYGEDTFNGGSAFELYIGVEFSKRVYLIGADLGDIPKIPECAEEARPTTDAAAELFKKASATSPRDSALLRKARGLAARAESQERTCFKAKAAEQPFFATWIREAKLLVDSLPPE